MFEIEVEVTLRPKVSRPVCLGVRRPSGTRNQFYFSLEIFFRQLQVCNFVAPSLTRGQALPEQSFLGRSPSELWALFYCLIWDSPNLEGQVPIFIYPRNRVAQLYPRALGTLYVASYNSQGCGGGILTRPHIGKIMFDWYNDCLNVVNDGNHLRELRNSVSHSSYLESLNSEIPV
jgi:hypothetical protein